MKIVYWAKGHVYHVCMKLKGNGGFGMNELLGIAAALIIAAFIIIPNLRTFATSVMGGLTSWWGSEVAGVIFANNPN